MEEGGLGWALEELVEKPGPIRITCVVELRIQGT